MPRVRLDTSLETAKRSLWRIWWIRASAWNCQGGIGGEVRVKRGATSTKEATQAVSRESNAGSQQGEQRRQSAGRAAQAVSRESNAGATPERRMASMVALPAECCASV